MLIGAILAFMAGPEIFRLRGEFPGVLITGEKGGGKTYTAKWLVALHGFTQLEAGVSLKTSAAVGVQMAMGQYANIPLPGDEYKENELREVATIGVIHSGFNREIPSKWSKDGRTWTIRTNLLVTGETTFSNAATMSRFVSTVAAREKRTGTAEEQTLRLSWLNDHRPYYPTVGRAARIGETTTKWPLAALSNHGFKNATSSFCVRRDFRRPPQLRAGLDPADLCWRKAVWRRGTVARPTPRTAAVCSRVAPNKAGSSTA